MRVAAPPILKEAGGIHPSILPLGPWLGQVPPPVRLHDLRHGAATLSLAAGVDIKVVKEMLGHATSACTRDVYTSVVPEIAAAAAEAVAAIVPRRAARANIVPTSS